MVIDTQGALEKRTGSACVCVRVQVRVGALPSQLNALRDQSAWVVNTGILRSVAKVGETEARAREVAAKGDWKATVFSKPLPNLLVARKIRLEGLAGKNAVSQIAVQGFRQPPSASPSRQG